MGLANKQVVLYQSIKIGKKWILCPVDEDSSHFSKGPFYVSWYDGKKKQMDPVGRDPEHALRMALRRRAALALIAAGGEVKNSDPVQNPVRNSAEGEDKKTTPDFAGGEERIIIPVQNSIPDLAVNEEKKSNPAQKPTRERKNVKTAISEYLDDCLDRQGKSGYGLAVRTPETYEYRLGFLAEFRPVAFLDEIDHEFVKAFRRFLRQHPKDLADRTCYNIMQAASTFLLRNGIAAAKPILKEMSFPPTVVIPYSEEETLKFFGACDETEELIFKFFLHSMARDMETAHCEVRDLKFDINVLHICPKPDRNFRLKGKRSGQATKGRKVPIPAAFMSRLKVFCAGKGPRQLLFPNGVGHIETHFLRKCEAIARRAGIANWEDFDLHRWRKTGATMHHEAGVSVRKIQAWLGHESLEVTLEYLGVDDAADEISQQQVNNGALAAFV
jgi:integrase